MGEVSSILGWAGLLAIVLFIAGLFYVDISLRRLLAQIARGDALDTALRPAAEAALREGFRTRLEWLKSKSAILQGDASVAAQTILRVHFWCWVALVIMFAVWAAAMLVPSG